MKYATITIEFPVTDNYGFSLIEAISETVEHVINVRVDGLEKAKVISFGLSNESAVKWTNS